jgi:DNA-binding CsgD family transcriptional regulator
MTQPRDQLTAKEIRVATLVWEGLTNREIAKIIGTHRASRKELPAHRL